MIREKQYHKITAKEKIKKLGQYFTPVEIADFMARWVSKDAKTVLDPAVGNGVFFRSIQKYNKDCIFTGYEIDQSIYDFFKENSDFEICISDYLLAEWDKKYDAIICNPPYNRFQSITNREIVLEYFEHSTGIKFSGYTNQYILFLIKSIFQMSDTGKLAFIVPLEFLNSKYGDKIKDILLKNHLLKAIITLDTNIFDNAVTTSCILLLDKKDNKQVEFVVFKEMEHLRTLDINGERLGFNSMLIEYKNLENQYKWLCFLKNDLPTSYANIVALKKYCKVSRGIATGDNDFFVFNKERINETGIEDRYFTICLCKSADIKTAICDEEIIASLIQSNKNVYLLDIKGDISPNLRTYLDIGYEKGVHKKYLTRHRTPWFSMESKKPAPIWITSASRGKIKIIRNIANVASLTTFHSLYVKDDYLNLTNVLFCYLLTPIAQELLSINKKELGNGLDKFQPNDLNSAMILDLEIIMPNDIDQILMIYNTIISSFDERKIMDLNKIFLKYIEVN